jgi:glycosyltransferase involved in cell wall biosynthesis
MKINKIKLLILSHSSGNGGAELALKSLVESTNKHCEWSIVYPTSKRSKEHLEIKGIKKEYFISLPWWCYEKNDGLNFDKSLLKRNLKKLDKIIPNHDLLLTNTITIPWLGFLSTKHPTIPHIWYIHEYGNIDHGLSFGLGYHKSLKFIENTSTSVLTISENLKDHLSKTIDRNKINIIHQAIDLEKLTTLRNTKLKTSDIQHITIASIAAIKPSKGQHLLVESLLRIKNKGLVPPKIIIRGPIADQRYYNELLDYKNNNPELDISGTRVDPIEIIKKSDVVFVGSTNEALGRATLEGLAARRLVIGANGGATSYLLANGRGVLFSTKKTTELDKIIENLPSLVRNHDFNKANRFATLNYNANKQSSEFINIIESIMYKNKDAYVPKTPPYNLMPLYKSYDIKSKMLALKKKMMLKIND